MKTLLAAAACWLLAAAPARAAPLEAGTAAVERVVIPVAGMHCDHCTWLVETFLSRVEGVRSAEASLARGRVIVVVDKSKLDMAKLLGAIQEAGYKAGKPAKN